MRRIYFYMRAKWSIFAPSHQGSTIIEFAFVGPIFLLLLMAIMAHGFVAFQLSQLDQVAYTAASRLKTTVVEVDSAAELKTEVICPILIAMMDCNSVEVGVQAASSYNQINSWRTMSTITGFDTGGPGDILIVHLSYKVPSIFQKAYFGYALTGTDEEIFLTSRYIVAREIILGT